MIRKPFPFLIALIVACGALGETAWAQDGAASSSQSTSPAAAAAQDNAAQVSDRLEDLSITANVTARELRFDVVPDPKVEFPGKPERNTVWEAERQNLPRPVEPGVTYRNIGIQLKITSVFADIDRIVAEALGEVPAVRDDESTTQPVAPPQQQQQQEEATPPTTTPANPPTREGGQP